MDLANAAPLASVRFSRRCGGFPLLKQLGAAECANTFAESISNISDSIDLLESVLRKDLANIRRGGRRASGAEIRADAGGDAVWRTRQVG
jgi:hypothetical protein